MQLWHCLPSFCSWAVDLPAAYPSMVKDLAAAFSSREDLRTPVCSALQRMCVQVGEVDVRVRGTWCVLGGAWYVVCVVRGVCWRGGGANRSALQKRESPGDHPVSMVRCDHPVSMVRCDHPVSMARCDHPVSIARCDHPVSLAR